MAYEQFRTIDKQTAANELEGRIEKLEGDAARALKEAEGLEGAAEHLRVDAASYARIANEYKTLLGRPKERTTKVTLVADVKDYVAEMERAKDATDALVKARERAANGSK